jgi:hypothetical protein
MKHNLSVHHHGLTILCIYLCVAGLFNHQASAHLLTVAEVSISVRGNTVCCIYPDFFRTLKCCQFDITYQNYSCSSKTKLFSQPLKCIYRFLYLVPLNFESFETEATVMTDVKSEPQFGAKVELMFNQEGETVMKIDSVSCVNVGTQCEEKGDDDDSIVVMKFSYSDTEDSLAAYQEDSYVVSVNHFQHILS